MNVRLRKFNREQPHPCPYIKPWSSGDTLVFSIWLLLWYLRGAAAQINDQRAEAIHPSAGFMSCFNSASVPTAYADFVTILVRLFLFVFPVFALVLHPYFCIKKYKWRSLRIVWIASELQDDTNSPFILLSTNRAISDSISMLLNVPSIRLWSSIHRKLAKI